MCINLIVSHSSIHREIKIYLQKLFFHLGVVYESVNASQKEMILKHFINSWRNMDESIYDEIKWKNTCKVKRFMSRNLIRSKSALLSLDKAHCLAIQPPPLTEKIMFFIFIFIHLLLTVVPDFNSKAFICVAMLHKINLQRERLREQDI